MAVKARTAKPAVVGPRGGSKLIVGFGMVAVPIRYKPMAETTRPIVGHGLCAEHGDTLGQQTVCSRGTAAEHVVENDEKLKGYEHPDTKEYVVMDDSIFAEFAEAGDGQATISRVVDVDEIDAAYFDKTYMVWADEGGGRAFDMLAGALRASGKAAVTTTVLSKRTRMLVFRWSEEFEALLAHVVQFRSRLRLDDLETAKSARSMRPEPSKEELELAKTVLATIEGSFDADDVEDEYTVAVHDAIRQAANGVTPVAKAKAAAPVTAELDLIAALKASVAAASGPKAKAKAKTKPKVKVPA